jgi:DNA mismatch endonuclease (patch repair protein)
MPRSYGSALKFRDGRLCHVGKITSVETPLQNLNMPRKPHRKKVSAPLSLSERMARIRKVDTKPELVVRKLLHAHGFRFRLHRRDLPGNPDIVLPGRKKVIFVHGCFWHRHDCPDGTKVPRSNPGYWIPKLGRNKTRDVDNLRKLQELGWGVLTLWECELADSEAVTDRLAQFLE